MSVDSFDNWRATALEFSSRALLSFIVVAIGFGLSVIVREVILGLTNSEHARLLARTAQYLILGFSFITAFGQAGLDVSLLNIGILAALGIAFTALALAFALGSRDYVANLMAQSELARINIGDRIRVAETEGVVVQTHKLGLDLATAEGLLTVPGKLLLTTPYLKISEVSDD